MTTLPSPSSAVAPRSPGATRTPASTADEGVELKLSTYEQVASLLVTLLVFMGLVVLVLLIVWFTMQALTPLATVPVNLAEDAGGDPESANLAKPSEEPALDEILEVQAVQPPETLAAVGEAIAAAELLNMNATLEGLGRSGDGRQAGPGGDGKGNAVPRHKRWELRFPPVTVDVYARQLDHFGIELGALGGGANSIDVASGFAAPKPLARQAAAAEKAEWLYLSHHGAASRRSDDDRHFLALAGVQAAGRVVVQFIPPPLEQQMAQLEQAHAGKRSVDDVAKTIFSIREAAGGFEMYVVSQRLRVN